MKKRLGLLEDTSEARSILKVTWTLPYGLDRDTKDILQIMIKINFQVNGGYQCGNHKVNLF